LREVIEIFFWTNLVLLACWYLGMLSTIFYIRKVKRQRVKYGRIFQWHKAFAITGLLLIFILIVVIESFIRIFDFDKEPDALLLWIHLPLATAFLVGLLTQIIKTGYKNSKWHRRIGYACIIVLSPLVTITGIMLFLQIS